MRELIDLLEAAPPTPKQSDILDAISHADPYEEGWTPEDFDFAYLGLLDLDQIGDYDDIDSWLEVHDLDDLAAFREGSFPQTVEPMPPIIVITAPCEDGVQTQIGDGRGRINYASAHGIPLHVWHMTFKEIGLTEAALRDRFPELVVETADPTTIAIRKAAKALPRGSRFTFEVRPDEIYLDVLRVSQPGLGHGRAFLKQVVAIADRAGRSCRLIADPTLEPDDPDQDALVRLYTSLGFEIVGHDDDTGGSPIMVRKPSSPSLDGLAD